MAFFGKHSRSGGRRIVFRGYDELNMDAKGRIGLPTRYHERVLADCQGKFVVNAMDLNGDYHCGLCHMPSRAGKTRKAKEEAVAA